MRDYYWVNFYRNRLYFFKQTPKRLPLRLLRVRESYPSRHGRLSPTNDARGGTGQARHRGQGFPRAPHFSERSVQCRTWGFVDDARRFSVGRRSADLANRGEEPVLWRALEVPFFVHRAVVFAQGLVQFHAAPFTHSKFRGAHEPQHARFAALAGGYYHAFADLEVSMRCGRETRGRCV